MQDSKYKPVKCKGIETSLTKLLVERPGAKEALIESSGKILPIQQIERNVFQLSLDDEVTLTFKYQGENCTSLLIKDEVESWELTLVEKLAL